MTTPLAIPRIYNALRELGRGSNEEISAKAFCGVKHTRKVLMDLRECGLVHIADYRKRDGVGGTRIHIWQFGPGEEHEKVVVKDHIQIRRKRRRRLVSEYGVEIARRIIASRSKGGADRIVVDGKTVYQRGKPRGKYARSTTARD